MNDNELSEMIKKAQNMINNNQVPPEIMQMANQIKNDNQINNSQNPDMSKLISSIQANLSNTQNPPMQNQSQPQMQSQPQTQYSSPLDQISNIARIAEIIKLLK